MGETTPPLFLEDDNETFKLAAESSFGRLGNNVELFPIFLSSRRRVFQASKRSGPRRTRATHGTVYK